MPVTSLAARRNLLRGTIFAAIDIAVSFVGAHPDPLFRVWCGREAVNALREGESVGIRQPPCYDGIPQPPRPATCMARMNWPSRPRADVPIPAQDDSA